MLSKTPKWLKNKYTISIIIFLILISFIDQNDIITQFTYRSQLHKFKSEKEYFNKEIENTRRELEELTKNPISLEKFAREKYFMKKDGEEIFVFTTK